MEIDYLFNGSRKCLPAKICSLLIICGITECCLLMITDEY